ncbi:CLUMA_CG003222, isoform A [Clunio marinus]|uniref:CLUMA_CG003222, isoform A n=1 Tax=Clunio marinus TaxID=568069 RepID=A0A1J1HSN5_9DIPT|nr:CLUMA_CG003222, isoform A [Clunio marinus]
MKLSLLRDVVTLPKAGMAWPIQNPTHHHHHCRHRLKHRESPLRYANCPHIYLLMTENFWATCKEGKGNITMIYLGVFYGSPLKSHLLALFTFTLKNSCNDEKKNVEHFCLDIYLHISPYCLSKVQAKKEKMRK